MKQLLALAALCMGWPAGASAVEPQRPADAAPDPRGNTNPYSGVVLNDPGFLGAHPDLRWRGEALHALENGRPDEAFGYFRRASRFADKPSQAMVAEMLWTGTGVPRDRPQAYAWMDIAAERAYVPFVSKREEYWEALDEAGRERALEVGRPLYEEYRDAVAQERLERKLEKAKRKITGSRVGFVGFLKVVVAGPGGIGIAIDGERFYDDKYWEPDLYWAWQDSIWQDPPTGTVSVEPLEVVREDD